MENVDVSRTNISEPFVIEFAGTPNSGKNTQIEILADYLRDYREKRVSILDELYHACTISGNHKKRLLWMYGALIKNLMEVTDEKNANVILINRGLFDILAFFELYCKQGHIPQGDLKAFSKSLITNSLCSMVDVVIVLTTTPEVSLKREIKYPRGTVAELAKKLDQWDPHPNPTLTNLDGLQLVNECYDTVLEKHKDKFKNVYSVFDDGSKSIDDIADAIVSYLHPFFATDKNAFTADRSLIRRKIKNQVQQLSFVDFFVGYKE